MCETKTELELRAPKCKCEHLLFSFLMQANVCEHTHTCLCVCVCCSWKCAPLPALCSEDRGWPVPLSRLGVSPNTGSYSWPDQVDVRFSPSSALHFHMNVEYAKGTTTTKILVPGSHRRVRKHTFAWRTVHSPPWKMTGISASLAHLDKLINTHKPFLFISSSHTFKPSQGRRCCRPSSLWITTQLHTHN